MKELLNFKRPTFWWLILFLAYGTASVIYYGRIIDPAVEQLYHDSYFIDTFRQNSISQGIPIVLFLMAVWAFPRVTGYDLSFPLALIQWGLFTLGLFLIKLPEFSSQIGERYVDLPVQMERYNQVGALGVWFYILGIAAFLPVLLEALVKKRPFDDKRGE